MSKTADAGTLLDSHVREAVATILRGLRASRRYVNKRGEVREIVDWSERRAAATLILAYVVGEPVQRKLSANVEAGHVDLADLEAKAKGSPALRRAVQGLLEVGEGAEGAG